MQLAEGETRRKQFLQHRATEKAKDPERSPEVIILRLSAQYVRLRIAYGTTRIILPDVFTRTLFTATSKKRSATKHTALSRLLMEF